MVCQDGFTMNDLVSYNYKHNEANGEGNQDGSSYNYSWNCGVEGPTRKVSVRQMRERQIKNAFLMMLLSQGVPMIYHGDEFGNSQSGNNNAYCQDNATGWTDWKGLSRNQGLRKFVKDAIAFRKAHPVLHMPVELKGVDYLTKGFPDVSLHGERAWYLSYENTSRLLGMMYYGAYAREKRIWRLQRMILFTSAIISTGKTGALLCPISRKACAGKKSQIPLFTEQDSVWRRKKNIKNQSK